MVPLNGEWTFASLLEHINAMMEANDRRYEQRFKDSQTAVDAALTAARTAVDAALSAAKEAVAKAEIAVEKRLEAVNEFRGVMDDRQRLTMPRTEAELRFDAMEKKLDLLTNASIERRGQSSGARQSWGALVAGIAVLIALITLALRFIQPK